jgi:hypothetical protein
MTMPPPPNVSGPIKRIVAAAFMRNGTPVMLRVNFPTLLCTPDAITKYLASYGYTLALNRHGDHWIITDADAVQAATFEIYWAAALTCIEEYYFA